MHGSLYFVFAFQRIRYSQMGKRGPVQWWSPGNSDAGIPYIDPLWKDDPKSQVSMNKNKEKKLRNLEERHNTKEHGSNNHYYHSQTLHYWVNPNLSVLTNTPISERSILICDLSFSYEVGTTLAGDNWNVKGPLGLACPEGCHGFRALYQSGGDI